VESAPNHATDSDWVAVALLGRPRGNRGELTAIALSSRPERYSALREVYLFREDGPLSGGAPFEIESYWEHRGGLVLKFRGCDSISAAECLAGAEVRIPMRERPEPPEGEYYHSDLIGCEVIDKKTGAALGSVTGFEETGGAGLLKVALQESGKEILVPFARAICVEIEVGARRIVAELPEGLKELNS
jgi:16S rRNA processing protein RimM